jgi:hypothetical protein
MKGLTLLAALVVASAPVAASAGDQQIDRPALSQVAAPAHVKVATPILHLSDSLMDEITAGDAPGILGGGIGTAYFQGHLNLDNPSNGIIQSAINAAGNPPGIFPHLGNCTAGKCF